MLSALLILQAAEKKGQTEGGVRTGRGGICTPPELVGPILFGYRIRSIDLLSDQQPRIISIDAAEEMGANALNVRSERVYSFFKQRWRVRHFEPLVSECPDVF